MIGKYFKKRISIFIVCFFFVLCFFVVQKLNYLPMEPFWYALLLGGVLLCGVIGLDYYKYQKSCRELERLRNTTAILPENFPEPFGLLDEEYQSLILLLCERQMEFISTVDGNKEEQQSYFSLWVHQIKTPLAAAKLVLQTRGMDDAKEVLGQELFKMEQYVEMVLQYTRLESISSDLELQTCDLYDMAKQAIKKYSVLFIYQKLSLSFEPFDCKVLTDEKWVVFVIEQILSNSIKYTRAGTISIYLVSEHTLVIEDTGMGIRSEDIQRIFEKGFTGFNGRMDKKSTGIGLYLCKQVMDKLGHNIQVVSELSTGTKVFLDFKRDLMEIE